ncbi:hypothetical protein L9W92_04765 [Pelotomaculum terephthalicicum JT]|uniref:DUF6544 family protein n=1 Tax=Pelotomaculum TaxID=191373 RepID=UPI0009CB9BBE|nr:MULTISPECIES: DUF6544 family protein [Pelotomaculum]MCG9967368.1 hypothetical protein [Pelotomaculum terephthalicicum JT]OPX85900.1 MAG: hypothetical protein A4E54_02192 [Pelotomaculum sp. PtaB.Bin117]OPY60969.1 MAG: hypothetical protein A4E56_02347 [Pelotomaculum sp. PtaU1.Bin065]
MPKAMLVALIILAFIILILAVSFIADFRFNQNVKREVGELFNNVNNQGEIIQKADLEGLPPIVQKWLVQSQVVGKERIRTVRLRQSVFMRLKEDGAWMPAEAEQYFTIDEPGFIWKAKVRMAPLLYFTGRDMYNKGKGHMLIKVLSLIKVADAKGKEIDQGAMLRYLAETAWFPTAALSSYIKWEEIDANSARATMSYAGITASGVFTFNEKGEVLSLVAERYGEFNGQYLMKTWSVLMGENKEFNGIRIPARGEVIWKLDTGDYNWFDLEIIDIEYNKPGVY